MAPDLISLRLPFNGGPGPGGADRGPQNGKEQRRRAAQGGSSLEVWRCGGVEAGRGTQCGAECLSVAGRGRVRACGRGLVWLQWHGRMERCRAGKPLPSLASNDKLFSGGPWSCGSMEECRSDRSIAQCGAAGGEIRRGGVAHGSHALTLSRPHATPITFFNSRMQARERERERERECAKIQHSAIQYSKVSLGPHRKWPVAWSYPSPHIAFPASLEAILLEIDGIACHAAFHPEASHKSRNVREHGCKSPPHLSHRINIRRHVKKYYYD
jgi:hypothetical protein